MSSNYVFLPNFLEIRQQKADTTECEAASCCQRTPARGPERGRSVSGLRRRDNADVGSAATCRSGPERAGGGNQGTWSAQQAFQTREYESILQSPGGPAC